MCGKSSSVNLFNHSIVCFSLYMCTVWEPASAGPISCLESPNTSLLLLLCLPTVFSPFVVHPTVSKTWDFITDKKYRVLLLISKSPWQGEILEISRLLRKEPLGSKLSKSSRTGPKLSGGGIKSSKLNQPTMIDNQTKPKTVFTTSYQYGDHNEEYVFACKGRPFAALISDILPTPDTNLIDHNLVRELGLKMTNLQCRKFHYAGHKMRVLGRVSTAVQCIQDGRTNGGFHLKGLVVTNLDQCLDTQVR